MRIFRRLILCFLITVTLSQCGRMTDFLYLVKGGPAEVVAMKTKVKEIDGVSKLDILWVIDNSGSMYTHQKAVVDNTDQFIKVFTTKKRLDWKMGLLSTHTADTPFLGFVPGDILDKSTPDPVGKFQNAVKKLGLNKGCPELVFQPLLDWLNKYPDFTRPRSVLAIMALTDTQEDRAPVPAQVETLLRKLKGDMKYVRFYGAFAGQSFGCPSGEPSWLYPASPFEYFIKLTGGKVFSLCTPDFGKDLADVGEHMASTVTHSKIALAYRPEVATLNVSFKGLLLPAGPRKDGGRWYYDFEINSIVFHDLEFTDDEESEIEITYEKRG